VSIFLQIMRELLGNVQPGITAEKRPAVPPATTNFRLPGSRNLAMRVSSVSTRTRTFAFCVRTSFDSSVFLHVWLARSDGNLALARIRLGEMAERLVLA